MDKRWISIIGGILGASLLIASIAFRASLGSPGKAQLMHDGILSADPVLAGKWNAYGHQVLATFVNGGGRFKPQGEAALHAWIADPHPAQTLAQVMASHLDGSPQADYARRELKRLDDEF